MPFQKSCAMRQFGNIGDEIRWNRTAAKRADRREPGRLRPRFRRYLPRGYQLVRRRRDPAPDIAGTEEPATAQASTGSVSGPVMAIVVAIAALAAVDIAGPQCRTLRRREIHKRVVSETRVGRMVLATERLIVMRCERPKEFLRRYKSSFFFRH
jgi:hypothetical protein